MKSRLNRFLCLLLALLMLPMMIPGLVLSVSADYENTYVNTGDQRADIIGVALTQLGYRQGTYGYTKYGAWYGSPYMDWCGAFISWCARQADVPQSVLQTSGYVTPRVEHFNIPDVFTYASGRTPQPGDIFFVMDGNTYLHAGIVYYIEGNYFYTLEGNTHDGSGIYGVYCRQRGLGGSYKFASPNYANIPTHTHDYSGSTKYEDAHPHAAYKSCAVCGLKSFTGSNGTLSSCITCKQANCSHKFDTFSQLNEDKHRATCGLCGLKEDVAHSYSSNVKYEDAHPHKEYRTCTSCGKKKYTGNNGAVLSCITCKQANCSHSYDTFEKLSDGKHLATCSLCDKQIEQSHNYQGAAQYESQHPHLEYKTCASCYQITYTGNLGMDLSCITCKQENCSHRYEIFENLDDVKHHATCVLCDKEADLPHQWTPELTIRETSCKEAGLKRRQCVLCQMVKETEIPILTEHSFGQTQYDGITGHKTVCEVCGIREDGQHRISMEWTFDSLSHWRECEDCGGRMESTPHNFTGDCESACADCGYQSPEGHMYGVMWKSNEDYHWLACRKCGEIKDKRGHTYTNDCDETCDICGYVRKTAHHFGDTYKSNHSGHWRICETCEGRSPVEPHVNENPPAAGEAVKCTACTYEMTPAVVHEHAFQVSSHSVHGHSVYCECGEKKESESHSWDPETEKCSVCQESVPVVGKQSALMEFVVEEVGVSSHLWLYLVLPVVALLVIALLLIFMLFTVRQRSRAVEFDEYDDEDDDDEDDPPEPSRNQKNDDTGMSPLSV